MAAIASYDDLVSAISEETDGRATSASIQRYIEQAEGEIRMFLARNPLRPMRTRTTITINAEYISCPNDVVKPIAIEVTNGDEVYRVPYVANENMSDLQVRQTVNSAPVAFTRESETELRFFPVPTSSYTGTLFFFAKLTGISTASQTNWLLESFPHIYQAGALYYAYRDMPDIEKASLMKGIFDEGLSRLSDAYPEPENEVRLTVDADMLMGARVWQTY